MPACNDRAGAVFVGSLCEPSISDRIMCARRRQRMLMRCVLWCSVPKVPRLRLRAMLGHLRRPTISLPPHNATFAPWGTRVRWVRRGRSLAQPDDTERKGDKQAVSARVRALKDIFVWKAAPPILRVSAVSISETRDILPTTVVRPMCGDKEDPRHLAQHVWRARLQLLGGSTQPSAAHLLLRVR